MITATEDMTVGMLSLALGAATMRQQAIAQNIANAGTAGYQRIGVSFEQRLAEAGDAAGGLGALRASQLPGLHAAFYTLPQIGDGAPVALDNEVADLSQITLHQQALLKALNRHFAVLQTAINEGKS